MVMTPAAVSCSRTRWLFALLLQLQSQRDPVSTGSAAQARPTGWLRHPAAPTGPGPAPCQPLQLH